MSFIDRLTKRAGKKVYLKENLISKKECAQREFGIDFCQKGSKCDSLRDRKCPVLRVLDKLAYYEDLEEQGKIIVIPCEIGDTVFCIDELNFMINECIVARIELDIFSHLVIVCEDKKIRGMRHGYTVNSFGKIIFKSREKAEEGLKYVRNFR